MPTQYSQEGSFQSAPMKTRAVSMVLLMIASALAGCTTGDPDGDGELGIDTDVLNQMIEDNLQDFINNSSVTVHQTIHYHNNTTYVVDDGDYSTTNHAHFNNTTNVDGGEVVNNNYDQSENTWNIGGASFGEGVNGSVSGGSMMFVAHLEFTAMDLFPDYEPPSNPQDNIFSYTYTYYDYLTNEYRTDTFTFPCSVYYVVGSQSNGSSNQVSFWEDNNNYYNAWEQMYNSTIADLLNEAGYTNSVMSLCEGNLPIPLGTGSSGYEHQLLTIDIPVGYAIEYIQFNGGHTYFGCSDYIGLYSWNCEENDYHERYQNPYWNLSEGPPIQTPNELYGGWENISVDFSLDIRSIDYYCRDQNGNWAGDVNSCTYDNGAYSVWPSSEYEFTLYYRFVPVVPVE